MGHYLVSFNQRHLHRVKHVADWCIIQMIVFHNSVRNSVIVLCKTSLFPPPPEWEQTCSKLYVRQGLRWYGLWFIAHKFSTLTPFPAITWGGHLTAATWHPRHTHADGFWAFCLASCISIYTRQGKLAYLIVIHHRPLAKARQKESAMILLVFNFQIFL